MARRIYIPEPEGPNAEFYRRAMDGVLHIQCCPSCGTFRHPPRCACAACGAIGAEWRPSAGRGVLYSWTVTHLPFDRGWAEDLPYVTAIIELDEGVRLVGHMDVEDAASLEIGMPLQVALSPLSDRFVFLTFRPRGETDERA